MKQMGQKTRYSEFELCRTRYSVFRCYPSKVMDDTRQVDVRWPGLVAQGSGRILLLPTASGLAQSCLGLGIAGREF